MELVAKWPEVEGEYPARQFYVVSVPSLDQLPACVVPNAEHFVLFVAADTTSADEKHLVPILEQLVDRGLAYCCAWGPGAGQLETMFDMAYLGSDAAQADEGSDDVMCTTAHEDESMKDALWFFANCAFGAGKYEKGCSDWIAVAVGNDDWTCEIRRLIPEVLKPVPEDES